MSKFISQYILNFSTGLIRLDTKCPDFTSFFFKLFNLIPIFPLLCFFLLLTRLFLFTKIFYTNFKGCFFLRNIKFFFSLEKYYPPSDKNLKESFETKRFLNTVSLSRSKKIQLILEVTLDIN